MHRRRKHWTQDELQILHTAYRSGLSDAETAARLPGRTPRAVEIKRHRLGLLHRTEEDWTPAEDRILRNLRTRGLPHTAIATMLGRTPASVRIRASRLAQTDPT